MISVSHSISFLFSEALLWSFCCPGDLWSSSSLPGSLHALAVSSFPLFFVSLLLWFRFRFWPIKIRMLLLVCCFLFRTLRTNLFLLSSFNLVSVFAFSFTIVLFIHFSLSLFLPLLLFQHFPRLWFIALLKTFLIETSDTLLRCDPLPFLHLLHYHQLWPLLVLFQVSIRYRHSLPLYIHFLLPFGLQGLLHWVLFSRKKKLLLSYRRMCHRMNCNRFVLLFLPETDHDDLQNKHNQRSRWSHNCTGVVCFSVILVLSFSQLSTTAITLSHLRSSVAFLVPTLYLSLLRLTSCMVPVIWTLGLQLIPNLLRWTQLCPFCPIRFKSVRTPSDFFFALKKTMDEREVWQRIGWKDGWCNEPKRTFVTCFFCVRRFCLLPSEITCRLIKDQEEAISCSARCHPPQVRLVDDACVHNFSIPHANLACLSADFSIAHRNFIFWQRLDSFDNSFPCRFIIIIIISLLLLFLPLLLLLLFIFLLLLFSRWRRSWISCHFQ